MRYNLLPKHPKNGTETIMANTFGKLFTITTFGESHGIAVGVVIDGCPPQIPISTEEIQLELNRRRPGQSKITTPRKETDKIEILSGVFDNYTLGTPIGFIVRNKNQNSNDYQSLKSAFRPSHADYTYEKKYGLRDFKGGGRSSARETLARVVAGAIAQQILILEGVSIKAYVSKVKNIFLDKKYYEYELENIDNNIIRCLENQLLQLSFLQVLFFLRHFYQQMLFSLP